MGAGIAPNVNGAGAAAAGSELAAADAPKVKAAAGFSGSVTAAGSGALGAGIAPKVNAGGVLEAGLAGSDAPKVNGVEEEFSTDFSAGFSACFSAGFSAGFSVDVADTGAAPKVNGVDGAGETAGLSAAAAAEVTPKVNAVGAGAAGFPSPCCFSASAGFTVEGATPNEKAAGAAAGAGATGASEVTPKENAAGVFLVAAVGANGDGAEATGAAASGTSPLFLFSSSSIAA